MTAYDLHGSIVVLDTPPQAVRIPDVVGTGNGQDNHYRAYRREYLIAGDQEESPRACKARHAQGVAPLRPGHGSSPNPHGPPHGLQYAGVCTGTGTCTGTGSWLPNGPEWSGLGGQ